MTSSKKWFHSARHFVSGTLLSRASGLARDISMAFAFGGTPELAAFMVAYRLAHLFRRLLGEGTFASGFVPHFEMLRQEDPRRSAQFFCESQASLVGVLLLCVIALEGVFWGLSRGLSSDWRQIMVLCAYMSPGLLFVCLYALNTAFLQCEKKFFIPAAAPIFFNGVWIAGALCLRGVPQERAMEWLALSISGAFFVQWWVTAWASWRSVRPWVGLRGWFFPRFFSSEWKRLARPLSLGVLGVGAVQFNSALDAIFARVADPSGPAYLWYAIRIYQVPLALFGVGLSGALLPALSRALSQQNVLEYSRLLQEAFRHSFALLLPCIGGIVLLGSSGIHLLYGHGDFQLFQEEETLRCLLAYTLGLVPAGLVLLLASGFYARQSFLIPAVASLVSVAINLAFNTFFVFGLRWGAVSIALSTSLSTFCNALYLGYQLNRAQPLFLRGGWGFFKNLCQVCVGAFVLAYVGQRLLGLLFPGSWLGQIAHFLCAGGIYMGFLAIFGWNRVAEWGAFLGSKRKETLG